MKNLVIIVTALLGVLFLSFAASSDTDKEVEIDYKKAVVNINKALNRMEEGLQWTYTIQDVDNKESRYHARVKKIRKNLIVLEEKDQLHKSFETLWFFNMFEKEFAPYVKFFIAPDTLDITVTQTVNGKEISRRHSEKCIKITLQDKQGFSTYWVPDNLPLPYLKKQNRSGTKRHTETVTQCTLPRKK